MRPNRDENETPRPRLVPNVKYHHPGYIYHDICGENYQPAKLNFFHETPKSWGKWIPLLDKIET